MSEKRRHRRTRLIEPAHITATGSKGVYATMLINVSHGGARLRVASRFAARDRVRITAPTLGGERNAHVVWADGTSIGVRFRMED